MNQCKLCKKMFSTEQNLKRHVKHTHFKANQRRHMCPYCNKDYSRRGDTMRHIFNKHKELHQIEKKSPSSKNASTDNSIKEPSRHTPNFESRLANLPKISDTINRLKTEDPNTKIIEVHMIKSGNKATTITPIEKVEIENKKELLRLKEENLKLERKIALMRKINSKNLFFPKINKKVRFTTITKCHTITDQPKNHISCTQVRKEIAQMKKSLIPSTLRISQQINATNLSDSEDEDSQPTQQQQSPLRNFSYN